MRGISVLAVIIGGVTDVALSGVLGIPFTIYVISSRGLTHAPKEQLQSAVVAVLHSSPTLYAVQLLIGLGCSVLGGFVAASIAKRRRMLNGILAAWLCVGVGVYSALIGYVTESVAVHWILIGLTPLCYALGALIKLKWTRTPTATI
jgi:hypothetical protein